MKRLIPIYALLTAFILIGASSCLSDDTESEPTEVSANTLVTNFHLVANDSVMALLDSVRFTIDVEKKLIYNADSLPKGTKITRLVPSVTCGSIFSVAEFSITDATTMADTTFTYTASENDSIDFTGKVQLTVRAADGISAKVYDVKVNVHQQATDTLYWAEVSKKYLPGKSLEPTQQKTITQGGVTFCLLKEHGEYTLAKTSDIRGYQWTKETVNFSVDPQVESFTATSDAFYILDINDDLYKSTDGINWNATGCKMSSLIGGYDNILLALTNDSNGEIYYAYYDGSTLTSEPADDDFPVSGHSNAVSYESQWTITKQFIVVGGDLKSSTGKSGKAWGFDGSRWACISNTSLPELSGMTLVAYYNYLQVDGTLRYTKYPVLLAFGGRDAEGKTQKTVYISYDNAVNWQKAPSSLQLPEYIPGVYGAQAIVEQATLSVDTRASKPLTEWQCPYIYLFGGYFVNGSLQNAVWTGAINRLSFKPII